MRIDFYYSPFSGKTSLKVDGTLFENKHSRVFAYLSLPIDGWLNTTKTAYHAWNGFFAELADEVNEDDFELVFHGKKEDYLLMESAFKAQVQSIIEQGYSPENMRLSYEPNTQRTQLKPRLVKFVEYHARSCKDQDYMMRMKIIVRDVKMVDGDDFAALRDIYDRLMNVFVYAKEQSIDKDYWDELIEELKSIYNKAV
ncbi:MAG: hypothetical protein IKE65_02310 [Clostridia bacterium]|nr:hypothetical protein [Clostridia bacterium]